MVRKAACRFGWFILLTSFLVTVPSGKTYGEDSHEFVVVTLHGIVTIQQADGAQPADEVPQIVDIGQSYILDPTDNARQSVRFYHREPIQERLEWQLAMTIALLPHNVHTTVRGTAMVLLSNRQGEQDITMRQLVEIPLLAPNTNHHINESVTDGQLALSVDLILSSQTITCDPALDTDCDTLPDSLEAALIERFKPMLIFATDEPVPVDEIAVVYQVSPKVIELDGRVEIMITAVVLYTHDAGVYHLNITGWNHVTCNVLAIGQELELGLPLTPVELLKMPINSHCGDSETVRLLVSPSETDSATWLLTAVYLKQHDNPWQIFVGERISEIFTVSRAVSTGSDHLVLYVSYAKHAMYPDPFSCVAYANVTPVPGIDTWFCTVTFEVCGANNRPVLLDTPAAHNVGERHRPAFDLMADSSSPILQRLFPNEYVWTESVFCGGNDTIPEPAYGLGKWCAESLSRKWWPPTLDLTPAPDQVGDGVF